jgi:hypothetical protein
MTPPDRAIALVARLEAYDHAQAASRWPVRIGEHRAAWLDTLSPDDHAALEAHATAVRDQIEHVRAECATRPADPAQETDHA